jgi:hypothetical protein
MRTAYRDHDVCGPCFDFSQELTADTMYASLLPMSLDFLTQAEFDVPTEDRVKRGLTTPVANAVANRNHGGGGMQLGAINKITEARIQWALAELTGMNLEKVSGWLDDLAKDSPAAALDRLIELLKFTAAQKKSMTVESTPAGGGANFGNLTLKQLQGLVFQAPGDVVSEQ